MARYIDNQWFCDCGEEAKWYTSGKEGTKGDRFIRCPGGGKSACRFFLWERNEPSEREHNLRASLPQTPQSARRTIKAEPGTSSSTGLPTPGTGSARLDDKLAAISLDRETSPTPRRRERTLVVEPEETGDLYEEILELFESEGVQLKKSVKVQLDDIIDMWVDAYAVRISRATRAATRLTKARD